MVRRRPFRHALAATIAALLIPSLAFGQLAFAPFILTTGVDENSFVTLAESTTFGPGGSVFDATARVVPKVYFGPPPSNGSYTNTETMADSCSSDSTTQTTLANLISDSHANNVDDDTVIILPPSCRIRLFVAPGYSEMDGLLLANKYDNVKLYCANKATCGFETHLTSVLDYTENNRALAVRIGQSGITGTGASYSIDASGYTLHSKMLQSTTSIDVVDSGDGVAWGPGDIVEIRLGRITGYGSNTPDWMTRITCVDGPTTGPGDRFGEDCDELTGDNQFQLQDIPPLNLHPNAYFWGNEGLGSAFTPHSSEGAALSGTYAPTSGHAIHQVERMGTTRCGVVGSGSLCGIGDETQNVPENIWLENVSFTVADHVLGTWYLVGSNWYGGGIFGGGPERTVGRVAAMTFGDRSKGWRVSHISLHSMGWTGTGFNGKCIGRILAINATDPITVDVETFDGTDCDDANGEDEDHPDWNEPETMFSWDVADARLAGKRFRTTQVYSSGTPNSERVTITGLNASSLSPALDTTVAGTAIQVDRFGGASFYLNDSSSYVQVVNSWFENTRQHAIMQGCAGCAYVHNFVTSIGSESEGGRGPFNHANRGESGNTFDGNDQTHNFVAIDSQNGEPAGHGEGTSHAYCFNRKRANPTLTWPDGTATGNNYGSEALFSILATGQNGAANDDWFLGLNTAELSLWQGTIDGCDNNDNDDSSSACVTAARQPNEPPAGQLFRPAVYRNRCGTCNQDTNFRAGLADPDWGTPFTDVRDTEHGDATQNPTGTIFETERAGAPQSCFHTETPEYWCEESGFVGQMGALWDDWSNPSTMKKLPAQIAYEIHKGLGGTCTPVGGS